MEQVCRVDWPADSHPVRLGHRGVVVCAWSSSNLFAFTVEKHINGFVKQFLNVINPNQPWDVFSTQYKGGEISCIEWDNTGARFLTGDSHGVCRLWHMPNSVVNVWASKSKPIDLGGEEILAVGWLHQGVRVIFHVENLEMPSATKNFARVGFRPSVVRYGGKPIDGYILVTGSGLVAVRLLLSGDESLDAHARLRVPSHQQLADITFTSLGKIVVLTSDGDIQHLIQFHEIELNFAPDENKLAVKSSALPSLPPKAASDDSSTLTHISHAKFFSRENQHQDKYQVLICISGPTGSMFESWLMRKEDTQVHRIFAQMPDPPSSNTETIRTWQFVTHSEMLARVMNFSIPALATDTSSSENQLALGNKFYCGLCIAVALADNSVQLLHRIFLKALATSQLPESTSAQDKSNGKRSKVVEPSCVRNATFSTMSCALIAADTCGGLLLYKVPPWLTGRKADSPQATKQLAHLLMYCLITGQEWWDILLHVQTNTADALIEQLTTDAKQQPGHLQQILQSRLQSVKINIYHISNNSAAMDCHLKLLFDAVVLVFRSLLRPHQQVTTEDTDPATRLQSVSCSSTEANVDKLLINVDTDPQTLQSMQQLIQWVADVTLYILASAPLTLYNKQPNRPGASLYRDRAWLSILREMLVLIRVWGLLKSACSPVFTLLDSALDDVLSHSFKLVTALWKASNEKSDPDAGVMNECSLLSGQVIIPPLQVVSSPNGILNHMSLYNKDTKFTFGRSQPDVFVNSGRQQKIDYVTSTASFGKMDALRRVYMGRNPNQDMKECTRCGITTMYNNLPRVTLKVWDQRFIGFCLCGGRWRKMESTVYKSQT